MPTPEKLLAALVDEAGEDAVASAASVGVEQAERELTAAGFDVKAEREGANAWLAELAGPMGPASDRAEPSAWVTGAAPEGKKSAGTRRALAIGVALALATAGGVLYALASREKPHDNPPVEVPREGPAPSTPTLTPVPSPPRQEVPSPSPRPTRDKP